MPWVESEQAEKEQNKYLKKSNPNKRKEVTKLKTKTKSSEKETQIWKTEPEYIYICTMFI